MVAQETTVYGKDLYGEKSLHKSATRAVQNIRNPAGSEFFIVIRRRFTDELIQTIKEEKKVCHYLDLPIQHANDDSAKKNGKKNFNKLRLVRYY